MLFYKYTECNMEILLYICYLLLFHIFELISLIECYVNTEIIGYRKRNYIIQQIKLTGLFDG